jgi:hypothetical protein
MYLPEAYITERLNEGDASNIFLGIRFQSASVVL